MQTSRSVLVVDDNPDFIELVADLLKHLGFDVLSATNGLEAIDKLAANDNLHTLFCDIDLPKGMNGLQLAKIARESRPEVNVVLCTGLPLEQIREFKAYQPDYQILFKPFTLSQLENIMQPLPQD